jgi:hypothetical protein
MMIACLSAGSGGASEAQKKHDRPDHGGKIRYQIPLGTDCQSGMTNIADNGSVWAIGCPIDNNQWRYWCKNKAQSYARPPSAMNPTMCR